jgi:hypothetical protein
MFKDSSYISKLLVSSCLNSIGVLLEGVLRFDQSEPVGFQFQTNFLSFSLGVSLRASLETVVR